MILMRCEGWRKHGGAFALGPIEWLQCENEAIVRLTVTQEGKTEDLPACNVCWHETIENEIPISTVVPLSF